MATVLYLHDALNLRAGNYPVGEQHSGTPNYYFTDSNPLRTMDINIGKAQVAAVGATPASSASIEGFARIFTSPPLKGNYSFGGVTDDLSISIAVAENNASANINNMRINAYIWRPSTGIIIATLVNNVFGKTEPSANVETVWYQNITSGVVNSLDGDVIVCEFWIVHTQATAVTRNVTFYYDGTTSNSTNNAVVSNHASYFLVQTNLTFQAFNRKSSFFPFFNS